MNKLIPDSQNSKSAALMTASVLCYSLVALFVAWGSGESPFILAAAWKFGAAAGCVLILLVFYRSLIFSGNTWRRVSYKIISLPMLFWVVSYFEVAIYAWSTQFIDVFVTATLYEFWPIALVFFTWWLFRDESRYKKITGKSFFLFMVALMGVGLFIFSQSGGWGALSGTAISATSLIFGVVLALCAALLAALSAFGFRWAADLASDLAEDAGDGGVNHLELFSVVLGIAICNLINLPLTALVGFARDEPVSWTPIVFGVAGGVVVAIAGLFWRWAIFITRHLEINIMTYLTPAFALGWLILFSLIGDVDVTFLAFGLIVILAANIGLFLELEYSRN